MTDAAARAISAFKVERVLNSLSYGLQSITYGRYTMGLAELSTFQRFIDTGDMSFSSLPYRFFSDETQHRYAETRAAFLEKP